MWNLAISLVLLFEVGLFIAFWVGRTKKRDITKHWVFIVLVLAVNMSLYLIPFLYKIASPKDGQKYSIILGLLDAFNMGLESFVGKINADKVEDFALACPLFAPAYLFGVGMAVWATVSNALGLFRKTLKNRRKLKNTLRQPSCDLVLGSSSKALKYAKTNNAIVLPEERADTETINRLIRDGYTVLRRSFSQHLLNSRRFNDTTRYHFICPDETQATEAIDTFISYRKAADAPKHMQLFVEVAESQAASLHRGVIEKHQMEAFIHTFCSNELMARSFTENNPVTKYLPQSYVEMGAIKSNTKINIFLLGFGALGQQLYRQSILNNQLVTFENGKYQLLPIHYYLCDTHVDEEVWNIRDLPEALAELEESAYFPLPDCPFQTCVIPKAPDSRTVLTTIQKEVHQGGYHFVIINTDNECCNMDIGAKLKSLLPEAQNFHLFVRSEASFAKNDDMTTHFGNTADILTHDVIVNDSLSTLAKAIHWNYIENSNRQQTDPKKIKDPQQTWNAMDHFTLYSNLYSALSLRVKLNLLGLDYVPDGKGENLDLLAKHYPRKGSYAYEEYFSPTLRNALLAQEHARWNAYHLVEEWLPMEKANITVKEDDGHRVSFNTKQPASKKHACITTYHGLHDLSTFLAEKAGRNCKAQDYDYYVYDESLILSAAETLGRLNYSLTEK